MEDDEVEFDSEPFDQDIDVEEEEEE